MTDLLLIVGKELLFEVSCEDDSLHLVGQFNISHLEVQFILTDIGELLLEVLFQLYVYLLRLLSLLPYLRDKFNLFEEDLALP